MQRDQLLIVEMIDSCRRIVALVDEIEGPEGDRLHMDALLWNFTVLGEASSQVSDALKQEARGIEWQHPIRLRNRIVHGYWSIDDQVLLSAARTDVRDLLERLVDLEREVRS
ncbi:MAG: DUF86 domain-containing protein [Acidimicrobiia bacterium]|nr:DUF86 domain-containing protein [Acidimicrobiia bacterium]